MKEEPDIVKELREAEKLGLLNSMIQSTFNELEVPDESIDKSSNETSYMIEPRREKRRENELNNVVEKYLTLFENYTIAITLADNKERIISWNKYTEELLNMNQNELYLKSVNSLYPPEDWKKIRAENVRQKGIKYRMETRMIRKNQGFLDVELSLCVLKGKEGKTVGSIGIIKDITMLKETERKFKASEVRYKTIFENTAVAITLTDENEQIISWNKYTENLLGTNKDDLYLKPVKSLYPAEEWQKIRSKNIRKKGLQYHLETKMFNKNNEIIDINLSLSVLKNHEGKVVGSIGVFQDITESKQMQNALQESEQKYRTLIDRANDGIAIIQDKKIEFLNQAAAQMLDYSVDEIKGTEFYKYIVPKVREMLIQRYKDKMESKKTPNIYETILLKKNGKKIPVEINASLIKYNGRLADFVIVRDITERKKAEEKIRYQADLINNVSNAVISTDLDFKIKSWNKAAEQIYGWKEKEVIGKIRKEITKLSFPNGNKKDIFKQVLKNEKWEGEVLQKHKNGKILNIYASVTIVKDNNGEPIGIIEVNRDITDRKKAEKELQISEDKFKNLAEYSPNMIFINKEGRVVYANRKCEEIMGYKRKEFYSVNFDFLTLIAPESIEKIKVSFKKHMNGEEIEPYEYKLITKDGKKIDAIITTKLIEYEEDIAILGIITDIGKQKKTEEELKKSHLKVAKLNQELEQRVEARTIEVKKLLKQKNEFINQLSHDLKNPLTPLVSLLPILEKTEKDPKSKELIKLFSKNINRIKNIAIKTLELSRLNSMNTDELNIEDINLWEEAEIGIKDQQLIINEKDLIFKNKIDENIFVKADKTLLNEVFNNLINNAIKYSLSGGNITIDANADRDFVTVSIEDSGIGMTTEQIDHIFDEFYKADKSRHDFDSSGLGLSICRSIVENFGGRIWAESPGLEKGSKFYFTIPIG